MCYTYQISSFGTGVSEVCVMEELGKYSFIILLATQTSKNAKISEPNQTCTYFICQSSGLIRVGAKAKKN